MSKEVIKTVDILDGAELDNKEGKRTILKVIDKEDNLEDRKKSSDTSEVFPNPSEPIMESTSTLLDQNAKDYTIKDLTTEDLAAEEDVKDVLDKVDIFKVLNTVDNDLTNSHGSDYGDINILFSRSSKDSIRESALIEYTTMNKNSYVLGLNILESEDNKVNFIVKSSYGLDIYNKECDSSKISNTVYRFLEAVYLRDKFATVLKESADSDRWGEILSDVNEYTKNSEGENDLKISYSDDVSKPLEVTVVKGTNDKLFNDVKNYIKDTYKDEVELTDIDDSSFSLK